MDETQVPDSIYTDLDSLFDTRLPVLYNIDPTLPKKLLSNDYYFNRRKDVFGIIPRNLFRLFYNKRDKITLGYALPTNIVNVINSYTTELGTLRTVLGAVDPLSVYVNTYPYKLTPSEALTMRDGLSKSMRGINVIMLDSPISDITPVWVDKTIGTLIMYEGMNWLEYHIAVGTLPKSPLLDRTLMVPGIIQGELPSKEVTKKIFDDQCVSVSTVIALSPTNVKEFCITLKK